MQIPHSQAQLEPYEPNLVLLYVIFLLFMQPKELMKITLFSILHDYVKHFFLHEGGVIPSTFKKQYSTL